MYCNTTDYSNMIYVEDPSVNGKNLLNSEARIVITQGEEEQIVHLNKTNKSPNSKFWLVGCLTTEESSYNFKTLNEFTSDNPELKDRLQCYERAKIDTISKTEWINGEVEIAIIDGKTKQPIPGAMSEVNTATESVSRTSDENGKSIVQVNQNGKLTVYVSAIGFSGDKATITMDCESTKTNGTSAGCKHNIEFRLISNKPKTKEIDIALNWGTSPSNLDLHLIQIDQEDSGKSCHTFSKNSKSCKNSALDKDEYDGGSNGGETITINNLEENFKLTYMVFVDSPDSNGLETSEAHLQITDGKKVMSRMLPETSMLGSSYWFAGCLKVVGDSFNFAPVDELSIVSPASKHKLYCENLFKENLSAGKKQEEDFCDGISMKIRLETEQSTAFEFETVTNASLTIDFADKELGSTQSEVNVTNGVIEAKIYQNGKYLIDMMETEDYLAAADIVEVNCDINDCNNCNPSYVLPVSTKLEEDEINIMMTWQNSPRTLSLNVFEYEGTIQELNAIKNKTNNQNGVLISTTSKQSTKISKEMKESQKMKVGMIFVENLEMDTFTKETDVGFTIYDKDVTWKSKMDVEKYGDEKFWIAGCYFIADDVSFKTVAAFLNESPNNVNPHLCLDIITE